MTNQAIQLKVINNRQATKNNLPDAGQDRGPGLMHLCSKASLSCSMLSLSHQRHELLICLLPLTKYSN